MLLHRCGCLIQFFTRCFFVTLWTLAKTNKNSNGSSLFDFDFPFQYNYFVWLTELSVPMDGRTVTSGADNPSPARHPGRRDGAAVSCGAMDSVRQETAGQVAPFFSSFPHPQWFGPPMVVVFYGTTFTRGRGRPGWVIHCLYRLFVVLPPQDPLPIQP